MVSLQAITFSPDNKFMFLSLQLNSGFNNETPQLDATGDTIQFNKSKTLVIARKEYLGILPCEDNIVHTHGEILDFYTYKAQQNISSNACLNSHDMQYYAGDSIKLHNGFEVGIGDEFSAEIESCDP